MANEVWKSKDEELISQYAERLNPGESKGPGPASATPGRPPAPRAAPGVRGDGIDLKYSSAPPPKDLLNYKNMDLEMSLWAKTQAGWMSVIVLLALTSICFVFTWILWNVTG
jgi:hypothetical protein